MLMWGILGYALTVIKGFSCFGAVEEWVNLFLWRV